MALANINVPSGGGKKTPAIMVSLPTQSGTLTYSGSAQTPTWSGYDSTQLVIGGTTSATNAGTYTATFTPQAGVTWVDGTSSPKSATWTIGKAAANLTALSSSVSVDAGKSTSFAVTTASDGTLTVTSSNTSVATATISGKTITVTGVGAGSATIMVAQAASTNYNAATTVSCAATVAKVTPTLTLSKTSASIGLNDATTFTITTNSDGALSVSSSKTGVATATLNGKVVTITGVNAGDTVITVSQAATTSYNTASATCTVAVAKAMPTLTLSETSGSVSANNGTKNVSFTSNSTGTITVTSSDVSIASISKQTAYFVIIGHKGGTATITVSQAATNDYAATSVTYTVTVTKETPELILTASANTVEIGKTLAISARYPASAGLLTVSSSNSDVATATFSGSTITVTGVSAGSVTITASLPGNNVYEAASKTFSVAVNAIPIITDSWATISTRAKNGTAGNYYKVGDCKEVVLNGKIGDYLELNNERLYVYILHINYPMNGTADNNIIWGGFKTADGKDVALCDSMYYTNCATGIIASTMYHGYAGSHEWIGSNSGGWKGTDFRYDILGATSTPPSLYGQNRLGENVGYDATDETLKNPKANTLLAALPADFRNALRLWSRWIDNKGMHSASHILPSAEDVNEITDAVTLLTEFEVYGTRTYANPYEQNHQTQMDYYKNGAPKIKNNHKDTSTAVLWACSSPSGTNEDSNLSFIAIAFCATNATGTSSRCSSYISTAIAPAFKV